MYARTPPQRRKGMCSKTSSWIFYLYYLLLLIISIIKRTRQVRPSTSSHMSSAPPLSISPALRLFILCHHFIFSSSSSIKFLLFPLPSPDSIFHHHFFKCPSPMVTDDGGDDNNNILLRKKKEKSMLKFSRDWETEIERRCRSLITKIFLQKLTRWKFPHTRLLLLLVHSAPPLSSPRWRPDVSSHLRVSADTLTLAELTRCFYLPPFSHHVPTSHLSQHVVKPCTHTHTRTLVREHTH